MPNQLPKQIKWNQSTITMSLRALVHWSIV